VLRRPLEFALAAGVAVMDQPVDRVTVTTAVPQRHVERVERQVGRHRLRCAPPDDHPGEHIDRECDVDEPGERRHIR
jgi:hypothetical protein